MALKLKHRISRLTNYDLDRRIKSLAQQEREILCEVLEHIKEADSRRLYLDLAYSSLFSYLVESCGYSAGAAQRRIDAARLLKVEPKLIEKIESGEVSLGQLTLVQHGLREKSKTAEVTVEEKQNLISQLSHKSTAETQVLIAQELDLEIKKSTKEIRQKDESVCLQITLTKEQWQKLEKARYLASNATQSNDWATLLEYLSDKLIKQKEGSNKPKVPAVKEVEIKRAVTKTTATGEVNAKQVTAKDTATADVKTTKQAEPKSTATMAVKKSVLKRDQSCQYKDHSTGKVCASRWNLHFDHVQPRWAGGSNDKENLRVLCAKHNHHIYRHQTRIKTISR